MSFDRIALPTMQNPLRLLQPGAKTAATVGTSSGNDFLCADCRNFDYEKWLIDPYAMNRDLYAGPQDVQDRRTPVLSLSLSKIRSSPQCLLCQFLFLTLSSIQNVGLRREGTLVAWTSPVAEYTFYGSSSYWDTIVEVSMYVAKRIGLSCKSFRFVPAATVSSCPKTTGWKVCVGIEPSINDIPQRQADTTIRVDGSDGRSPANTVSLLESRPRQVRKGSPDGRQISTGFESPGVGQDSGKLSYPTCKRDIFHAPWKTYSRIPAQWKNADISPLCIQIKGTQADRIIHRYSADYETENILKCRGINMSHANFALARQWRHHCHWMHWPFCEPLKWTASPSAPFALRVIDVHWLRVVHAPRHCQYAALSYVWGKAEQVCATRAQEFTQIGALHASSLAKLSLRLPRTVSDAMEVCKSMRLRYLWVDCLCIVQDDTDKKARQINGMGYVYGGAQITIVAGHGNDADAGLPGVRGLRRKAQYSGTQINNLKICTAPHSKARALLQSPWYTRGWTFQELVFSKRLLMFTEEQMLFFCVRGAFVEDTVLEAENGSVTAVQDIHDLLETHLKLPAESFNNASQTSWVLQIQAIKAYEDFLSTYLRRKLTHDTDILNAFSGILHALSPYIGPSRWGLPIFSPSHIFAWHSSDRFPLPRRIACPSWSWAGWKDFREPVRFMRCPGFEPCSAVTMEDLPRVFVLEDPEDATNPKNNVVRCRGEEYLNIRPIAYTTDIDPPVSTYLPGFSFPRIDPSTLAILKDLPYDQYIVLVAECRFLTVDSRPSGSSQDVYSVYVGDTVTSISIDPIWREDKPDQLEFMILPGSFRYHSRLMLISRDGPVAFRIQIARDDVPIHPYSVPEVEPQLIILG